MKVKGNLEQNGNKTNLTSCIDGRIAKSSLVDIGGTIHVFTKVYFPVNLNCILLLFGSESFANFSLLKKRNEISAQIFLRLGYH